MSWYKKYIISSGNFILPNESTYYINQIVNDINNNWNKQKDFFNISFNLEKLIGIDKYMPTRNSIYNKIKNIYENGNFIINFNTFTTGKISNIGAKTLTKTNNELDIYIDIVFYVNAYEYKNKSFKEIFIDNKNQNIKIILEHELTHIIRNLLGYEILDNYVSPISLDLYRIQPIELEAFYGELYNTLIESVKTQQEPTMIIDKIITMMNLIKKHNNKKLKNFTQRINGIINKIDLLNNTFWNNTLRLKIINAIR